MPTVGKNLQEQTNNALGAAGDGFDARGVGPNDVLAFPSLAELFGADAEDAAAEIERGLDKWAEEQAGNALSKEALRTIFGVQASTILDDSCACLLSVVRNCAELSQRRSSSFST
jgi:choline dehydrogenase